MIRVYGYQSSMRVFLSHPIIGVGFLGCRYISQAYNDLGLTMLGAENLYLETASGLGIVGLVVLGNWYVRAVQVGRAVTRVVPRDSLAHAFGAYHLPLLVGLSVWSMVGDGLMGMTGVGQLALWFAMLVRSSQIAVERAEGETPAPA
jgi:O-antigen ligase